MARLLAESELLELLLQFFQHAFLLVDLGFALLDGLFQLFLLGHDVSPFSQVMAEPSATRRMSTPGP